MTEPFLYTTSGRNRRAMSVLILVWFVLGSMVIVLSASLWIIGILALCTLPLLADIAFNPQSGLRIDGTQIEWFTGKRSGTMPLAEIDKIRIDIRLDQSARVTLIDHDGRKTRLPYVCLPPARRLEAEARARGITVQRHPFSLL